MYLHFEQIEGLEQRIHANHSSVGKLLLGKTQFNT